MVSQPLKIHGGKGAFNGKLARWILSLFPPADMYDNYVETNAGGLSVLLHRPADTVKAEIVNDLNGEIANFWYVMRDEFCFEKFRREVDTTPFARVVFEEAKTISTVDPIRQAWATFVKCRQSRQALGKDFATLTKGRLRAGMNEQVSAWLSAVEGLDEVAARLRGIVVENCEASDLIRRMDALRTLFYVDPPYWGDERTSDGEYGEYEMDFAAHVRLLRSLVDLKGWFFLSGYRSPLYDLFAYENNWTRHDLPIVNNAASGDTKKTKVECVWTNWKASLI